MRVALRGILANRMRSGLTMLGILIGTAAVILLVAVGTGISQEVQSEIRDLGTNANYVLPERNSGGQEVRRKNPLWSSISAVASPGDRRARFAGQSQCV